MRYRTFGRTGWQVGEIGYGMWGMAGWSGSDDAESMASLQTAVDLGVNVFDTAWAYGEGHSERLLGNLLRANPGKTLYVATKIPPKNFIWPAKPRDSLEDVFPPQHIRTYTKKSLANLGVESIDLMQLHVWQDAWARNEGWQREVRRLKDEDWSRPGASASTAGSPRTYWRRWGRG